VEQEPNTAETNVLQPNGWLMNRPSYHASMIMRYPGTIARKDDYSKAMNFPIDFCNP
jgi:hypothetical protein